MKPQNAGFKPDNLSVMDQPGWTLVFIGLFISFLIGFSLNSFLAPGRVKGLIESASQRIHKDFSFKIGQAEASLSKFGWPSFSVIVSDIRISSTHPCFQQSVIDIYQIEIPVSFWSVLQGHPQVDALEIGEVEWRLPKVDLSCNEFYESVGRVSAPTKVVENKIKDEKKSPSITPVALAKNESKATPSAPSNLIQKISLQKLRIIVSQYSHIPLEVRGAEIEVLQHDPLKLRLKAQLELFRDSKLSDYLTHSRVVIDYDENDPVTLSTSILGNVREGTYTLHSQLDLKDRFLKFESEVQHFPVSELFPLFEQSGVGKYFRSNKQLWLSGKFNVTSELDKLNRLPKTFTHLKLEGEAMDITSPKFEILSMEPLKFTPFQIQVQRLNLDLLNDILVYPLKHSSVQRFGNFMGAIFIRNEDEMSLAGELRDLELIFANKGKRQNQKFKKLSLDLKREKNQMVKININRFEPEGGAMIGEVNVTHDLIKKFTYFDFVLDELRFSESVTQLMTSGGEFSGAQGHLNMVLSPEKIESLKGRLILDEVNVDGVAAQKATLDLIPDHGQTRFKFAAQNIALNRNESPFLFESLEWPDPIEFKQGAVEFLTKDFKSLEWNRLSFSNDKPKIKITSTGRWNQEGELSGSLRYEHDKKVDTYEISGQRNEPRLKSK